MKTKQAKILGISSCLLGEKVRYDGGHKQHHYITDQLSDYFRFIPVCPEVESGLPIPREAMHLSGDPSTSSLITVKTGHDLTEQMQDWCQRRVKELEQLQLRGFILKKNSPSCGLFRVKVYQEKGPPLTSGQGLFARTLADAFPLLPVEEEGRLSDARLRENFIERVYSYDRLLTFLATKPAKADLIQFHTIHKLLIMAHSPDHYRQLGRLVASTQPLQELLPTYTKLFMAALQLIATPAKQANVLMHCQGYFKKQLAPWEKQELLGLIDRYRIGQLPLIVPITLLNHYVSRFNETYLSEQLYFSPHPDELMLRNHA
ncbi:MAG: DUF523 and DUF1722 domain-containing protein [Geobacteraceae bacterium]|nr:DUF523 and DUF1722 domain-containing protein [Geobacteraceae bacterium]